MHFDFSQWWLCVIPFLAGLFTKRDNLAKTYGGLLVLGCFLVGPFIVNTTPDLQHIGWLGYVVVGIICFLYITFWTGVPVGLRALFWGRSAATTDFVAIAVINASRPVHRLCAPKRYPYQIAA
jgi:hypothetical protein